MTSRIGVGIIGFGTVGTGVAKVLLDNAALIRRRVGVPVDLVRIADLDITRDRGILLPSGILTTDAKQVIHDPAVDVVIELIGGYDIAKRVILEAMAAGKQVVTANKALLALHGEEIFEAASRQGVDVGFEASVGGGIPVVRALMEGLAGNTIESIYGIINGTSNYILSRMTREGESFDSVLKDVRCGGDRFGAQTGHSRESGPRHAGQLQGNLYRRDHAHHADRYRVCQGIRFYDQAPGYCEAR